MAGATDGRRRVGSPRALMAAEEILAKWSTETDKPPLDRLVQTGLRGRHFLNSSERRWVGDAVFGSVRYWRRQALLLSVAGLDATPRTRIELWARQFEQGESESEPGLPGPEDSARYLRETLSFPDAMADALEQALGPDAPAAATALNLQAPTTLRTNTLRTDRAALLRALRGSSPTRFSPWGVKIEARANIHELPGFQEGRFEVQEEASQLVALLTDARPGDTVADVGAGGGGKSLALAALMRNEGVIVAVDTSLERLARLEKRAQRAGTRIVRQLALPADDEGRWQLSATKQRTVGRLARTAKAVLVDAPCTGSGILRRSPDLKWRTADIESHARLQLLLLQQSAEFVAPGGCLVYATCAFEQSQDEDVVQEFLRSDVGGSFEVRPVVPRLARAIARVAGEGDGDALEEGLASLAAGPFLRTWPHLHGLDAFFAACLVRRE